MSELLFNHDYQLLIKNSHPHLNVAITQTGLPYYLAPLPYFEVFKPGLFKSSHMLLAKKIPHILNPNALVIGLPFEPYEQTAVLTKLPPIKHLKEMAFHHQASFLIVANVDPLVSEALGLHKQFLTLRSLPNMVLENRPGSSFFAHLNKKRHGHVQRSHRHFFKKGYQLIKNPPPSLAFHHHFYSAYEKVYEQAKVPWLKYNRQYFENIGGFLSTHQIVAVDEKGSFLGAINSFHHDEKAHVARLAVDERFYRKDGIFFMLLYEALQEAASFGAQEIHLGPTAYELKKLLGAKPKNLVNLILPIDAPARLFSPLGNFLLNHVFYRHLRHFEGLKRYF